MNERRLNPLTCTEPHPDHFDASKFGPNGERLYNGRAVKFGRPSKLKAADVEQLLFLLQLAEVAAKDVDEFLAGKGYKTPSARRTVLDKINSGWRPVR